MIFEARYKGVCQECFDWFQEGTSVKYNFKNEIVHDQCPELVEEKQTAKLPLCNKCFCYHNGECV